MNANTMMKKTQLACHEKLIEQDNSDGKTANKGKASTSDKRCDRSEVVLDVIAVEPKRRDSKAVWFESSFAGLIGIHGSIKKDFFQTAVDQIEVGLSVRL